MLLDHPVAWLGNKVELAAEPVFELGGISIDPVSREATFGGQRERLQPQNLKVLILLARRKGQVVTRDDIVECCWGARFVGDDVINRSISTLRQFAKRAGGLIWKRFPRRLPVDRDASQSNEDKAMAANDCGSRGAADCGDRLVSSA